MNLLLLLSALLSALTGASASARAPQLAVAVTRAAETAQVAPTKAGPTTRPAASLSPLADLPAMTGATWALTPIAPLYLSRRRE